MTAFLFAFSGLIATGLLIYLFCMPPAPAAADEEHAQASQSWSHSSLSDRMFAGLSQRCVDVGRRLTPRHYIDACETKLRHAGRRGPEELDRFLALRLVTAVVGIALGLMTVVASRHVFVVPGVNTRLVVAVFALGALFALLGPDARLNREANERRTVVQQSLPDVLDLLTISVEAGVGFEQAIGYVTQMMEGPLPEEFGRMNAEMRAGSSRSEALRSLQERVGVEDLNSFITVILQADKFGVSIATVLRAQSDEMRTKRRQHAQEVAQKAPVKMLVPITLFIFPPLFIVLLGPAMMSIAANLG
jgi:tight adherence protein C